MDLDALQASRPQAQRADTVLTPKNLAILHNPKNYSTFFDLGGLPGLERGLRTDLKSGLNDRETRMNGVLLEPKTLAFSGVDSNIHTLESGTLQSDQSLSRPRTRDDLFSDRRRIYSDNQLPIMKQPTFPKLLWMSYNDPILFLLTAAAIISLAIGLYQTFGADHSPGTPSVEWVEGVAIIVAIVVIVLAGSLNDWEKQRQFQKLNKKQQERDVKVVRSGVSKLIHISELLVGDVIHLEPGDVVPADGIMIYGYNVICDESSTTGEADLIHKASGDRVFTAMENKKEAWDADQCHMDPFLLAGTKVLDGIGTFLVTATGTNSTYGKILATLRDEPEPTPLQVRLVSVAKHITQAGAAIGTILFAILFIRFLAALPDNTQTPSEKGKSFVNIVIISLTVLVIAIPEGLPLAVTLSLAYASTRMLRDNNLVRHLKACETMGNATNICSDKTGTLTQNDMVVTGYAISPNLQFYDQLQTSQPPSRVDTEIMKMSDIDMTLDPDVAFIIQQSIALNSTAIEECQHQRFIGSSTESALLKFARIHLGMGPLREARLTAQVTQVIPFNAERQCMATIIQLPDQESRYRVFIKGASEVLLNKCSKSIDNAKKSCQIATLNTFARRELSDIIDSYATHAFRTICLAYRDISLQPSQLDQKSNPSIANFTLDYLLQDLTFLGVVGIHDPLRPGVIHSVEACQRAGVTVRMVTGDNIQTANAIARQCGILSDDGTDKSMQGREFRTLSDEELKHVVPCLKVLARSSPQDKQRLVALLKDMGETVAVTGDGTNDAPALSTADVSFSMGGNSGTEIAREASSIVLMTDDFTSIVKAIAWGRAVNDSVKKFLQVRHLSTHYVFVTLSHATSDQPVPDNGHYYIRSNNSYLCNLKFWRTVHSHCSAADVD